MAEDHPDGLALVTPKARLTYRELNERADRLAHDIVGSVRGTGERVAMQISGTSSLLVSSLAILRSGLVTVPIDPTSPPQWRDEVVRDCEAALLLSDAPTDHPAWLAPPCPMIDPRFGCSGAAAPVDIPIGDISAIVYTSGSTGVPKGVVKPAGWEVILDTDGLGGRVQGMRCGFLGQGSVGLAYRLLLMAVEHRAPISAYELRSPREETIASWIARSGVGWLWAAPTVVRQVLTTVPAGVTLADLRLLFLVGEAVTGKDLEDFFGVLPPDAVIVVNFGSTETGGFAAQAFTADTVTDKGLIPIPADTGRFQVEVEDAQRQKVPDGEVGHLVVVPPSPPVGYWRRPELDAAVFEWRDDGRVHVRTGDRARRRPDGAIEHLGRFDHVVKVAGNRVELRAIEAALIEQGGVADAAAAPYLDSLGSTRITAAVVARRDSHLSPRVLRFEIARRLPPYMVPDEVMLVPELPRLAAGKVDRRELAAMRHRNVAEAGRSAAQAPLAGQVGQDASEDTAPDPLIASLRAIFCDVLQRSSVGYHDDFFDLGGDSLQAVELLHEIELQIGFTCAPALLLQAANVYDLAHLLRARGGGGTAVTSVQLGETDRVPLFVVDAGTSSLFVSRLAELLGVDQPVYDLWASADEASFEAVAMRCVEAFSAVVPTGPYVLYGFSLSAALCFEMALQLQAAGRPPRLLVIGDAPAPGRSRLPSRVRGVWRRTLADPRPSRLVRRTLNRARGGGLPEPAAVLATSGAPLQREWERHVLLAEDYRPTGRLACPAVLYRSDEHPYGRRGWSRHIAGEVRVRRTSGDHFDQVGDSVPELAQCLRLDLPSSRLNERLVSSQSS